MSILINNLTKFYKKNKVLNGLYLKTPDNGIFALLGLNGAGKTTTINIICSAINKTGGEVIINGKSINKRNIDAKRQIGLSPQENSIDEKMTVYENLDFFGSLYKISNKKEKILHIIKRFGLENKTKAKAKNLSGGQKRKLSLAMALITEPKILILDEPTLGLDVISRKELWSLINLYKKDVLIIFTTHYIEEAEKYADDIAIISNGKIVAHGNKNAIIKKAHVKNFTDAFIKLAGGYNA